MGTGNIASTGSRPMETALRAQGPILSRHLRQGRASYLTAVLLVAGLAIIRLSPPGLALDLTYAAMGGALLSGALLTVRLRPGEAGGSLVIVPLLVAHARLGASALPALALASVAADLLRGRHVTRALTVGGHDVLSFAVAHLVYTSLVGSADLSIASMVFGLVFILLRSSLNQLAGWAGALSDAEPTAERPDALLSLLVAPLSALPILTWVYLGDGALLLALVALLTLLAVAREAANLATARAEAEAERGRWERAFVLQEELTQLITHEVRNPLTTIITYCDLADEALRAGPEAGGDPQRHLERIRRAGRSIARLVENLFQLSKLEGTDQLPAAEPLDLAALARGVIADIEPLAEQKAQQLVLSVAEGTPGVVASRALLQEALSNLASNAVKYTPEGGTVTVWAMPASTNAVALGVTDTGVGLTEEDQRRLFTKFFRSRDPRVRRERGAGLGLALTHSVVERLGGRLTVESALNKGATFRIELPARAHPDVARS